MKANSLTNSAASVLEAIQGDTDKIWLYGGLSISVLLVCIFFGLWKYFHSDRFLLKRQLRQGIEDVDFENTINSAFGAKVLYNMLKGKCHPDNFSTDPILFERATEIFSLLVKNKYNYRELSFLKERAEKELNIIF